METIFQVEIEASTVMDLKTFTDEIQPDLGCRPILRQKGNRVFIVAYLPETTLEAARRSRMADRVVLRVVENVTVVGRERQNEVGQGNRFAQRSQIPQGLGQKE
jgi:hypothetical protein